MKKNKSYNPKSGFKVPENYFEEFETKMMGFLEEGRGNIDDLNKDNGFRVPNGYFETLEQRIFDKIEEPKQKGKLVSIFNRRKLYAVAAVAAIFIGIISTQLYNPASQQTFNSLDVSAMEEYIDSGNVEFEYNDISSFIYEEGYVLDNINKSEVSDEAVFDYLNENIEDPALIIE